MIDESLLQQVLAFQCLKYAVCEWMFLGISVSCVAMYHFIWIIPSFVTKIGHLAGQGQGMQLTRASIDLAPLQTLGDVPEICLIWGISSFLDNSLYLLRSTWLFRWISRDHSGSNLIENRKLQLCQLLGQNSVLKWWWCIPDDRASHCRHQKLPFQAWYRPPGTTKTWA